MVNQENFKGDFVKTEDIEKLLAACKFQYFHKVFDKVTVVIAKLPNGFTITESSGCVNPDNYSYEIGEENCKQRIKQRLWELEGYALQDRIYREPKPRNI